MQISNLAKIWRHFALFFLSTALVACHLPSPSQNGNSDAAGATFSVDTQDANFTAVVSQNSIGLPTAKTISTKFCVKDLQFNKVVGNHQFTISGEQGQNEQSVTTDSAGCAVWQENLSYNHLSAPAFVEWQRTITAKGYQRGSRKISFAINPWQDKILSLKDSRVSGLVSKEQAQARIQGLDATSGQASPRPLWLQAMAVIFTTKQLSSSGTDYAVEIQAEPKIILKDMGGLDVLTSLTQGKFTVKLSLIREQSTGKTPTRTLLSQTPALNVESLTSNVLAISSEMKIPGGFSLSQCYLGVEVAVNNAPQGLQEFHGIYQLGQCSSIVSRQLPRLLNDGEFKGNGSQVFKIESFLTSSKTETPVLAANGTQISTEQNTASGANTPTTVNPAATASNDSGVQKSSIQIGQIEARSYSFSTKNSYEKERKFYLNFCLSNALDNSPIRAQSLKVTGVGGKTLTPKTFVDGCASVEDSFTFNYYSAECWKKQEIRIQSDDLELNEKIPVEINVFEAFGPFFRDLRFPARLQDGANSNCAQGQSSIIATNFSLSKVEYNYSVDELLNLQIHKTGTLSLKLSLNRPSLSSATGAENQDLPVGPYTLRWAVVDLSVKDYAKAAGFIYAAGEKEVSVLSNSTINDTLTLSLANLKTLGNTNYILIEVVPKGAEPKNHLSGMRTSTFRAPINLTMDNVSTNFEITSFNSVIPTLIQQYKKDLKSQFLFAKRISTKEYFAANNNLKLINLRAGPSLSANPKKFDMNKLHQWVISGTLDESTLNNLCSLWMSEVLTSPLKSKKVSPFAQLIKDSSMQRNMINECISTAKNEPRRFFDIEYRYLVQRGSKAADLGAYTRDFTINQSFSLSNTFSLSDSQSLAGEAGVGARVDAPIKFLSLSASTGFKYTFLNLGWHKVKNLGNSINVNNGIAATVETIGLKVRAEDYEKCAVIKLNGNQLFNKQSDGLYNNSKIASTLNQLFQKTSVQMLSANLNTSEKQELSSRGFMICTGERSGRPLVFDENYYVVNQKVWITQAMDNATDKNRPFFVSLRGRADFVSFMSFVENTLGVPSSFDSDYQQSHLLHDPLLSVFNRGFRSYPGQLVAPR